MSKLTTGSVSVALFSVRARIYSVSAPETIHDFIVIHKSSHAYGLIVAKIVRFFRGVKR